MNVKQMPNTGAWQVSALVTNGHDSWLEIRTFYGIGSREAEARYCNTILSLGWWLAE
jgi:hypothetical protein